MPETERLGALRPPFRGVERRSHDLKARPVDNPPAVIEESDGRGDVLERERVYRRSLAFADLVATALALFLATGVFGHQLGAGAFVAIPLIIAASKLQGLYDRDGLLVRKTTLDELPELFRLATLATLGLWLLDGALLSGPMAKREALLLWALLPTLTLAARRIARFVANRRLEDERCLFIGDSTSYERLRSKFDGAGVRAELVARMNLQRVAHRGSRGATVHELRDLIDWARAQRVIIDPSSLPRDEMLDLVRVAKSVGVQVSLLPRVLDVVGSEVVFDHV